MRRQIVGWILIFIFGKAIAYYFNKARQKGSHERWQYPDGRATTIPLHGKAEIGSCLFQEIFKQMGITEEELNQLR